MNKIKYFCEKYQEKLKNDKLNGGKKDIGFASMFHKAPIITFRVCLDECHPGIHLHNTHYPTLLTLDSEDLEYLFNKYLLQIPSEIEEIKKKTALELKDLESEYKKLYEELERKRENLKNLQ